MKTAISDLHVQRRDGGWMSKRDNRIGTSISSSLKRDETAQTGITQMNELISPELPRLT